MNDNSLFLSYCINLGRMKRAKNIANIIVKIISQLLDQRDPAFFLTYLYENGSFFFFFIVASLFIGIVCFVCFGRLGRLWELGFFKFVGLLGLLEFLGSIGFIGFIESLIDSFASYPKSYRHEASGMNLFGSSLCTFIHYITSHWCRVSTFGTIFNRVY